MPTSPALSRRRLLRGFGAMMSLPFFESIPSFGATSGKAMRPPMRMGIFTVAGGTVNESWRMKQGGALTGALPSILRPLEFCKQDLLLLTGLGHSGRIDGLNGHESCAFTHLTGAPEAKKIGGKAVAAISVDQRAAQVIGAQTFLPSLEMGTTNGETKYSFADASTTVPYENNPRMVFDRMFRGGRKPVVPNWLRRASSLAKGTEKAASPAKRTDSYDQSVLDLVMEDAKSLQRNLSHSDQQRLDEYLTAVRSVETRMSSMEARLREEALDLQSPGPSKLALPNLPEEYGDMGKMQNLMFRDPDKHGEYIRLMADLMVLAFQTDTTRVCTLAAGADDAHFPGVVTVGYERHAHTLEHQGNDFNIENSDPIAREACRQIHAWYVSLFAEMVRKMKTIDEGGSTLLDNTLLLNTSYMAHGNHGRDDYPILLVGNAQGTLKTGRQVDFQKNTPVSNLYVEMLNRVGVPCEEFGENKTSKHVAYDGRLTDLG
jgi:Protein of unknown function (DUF1552)